MLKHRVPGAEPLDALIEVLDKKKPRIQKGVLQWSVGSHPRYPWREVGKGPYEVLIGEVWLNQTSPTAAVHIYDRLVERFHSLRELAEASEADLSGMFSELRVQGNEHYFKTMAEMLWKEGKGEMPGGSEPFFQALGLEHHSIRAVMCFGYGLPVAVIDSNVARMLSRIFGKTLPPRPARGLLNALGQSLLAEGNPQQYNRGLLDLAEFVCRHVNPLCTHCPVREVCDHVDNPEGGVSHTCGQYQAESPCYGFGKTLMLFPG